MGVADAEVRVTSETGGQKGKKQAQVGALDPQALLEVARVAGFGTDKYERYNFLKGYDWSLSFDALCRHLFAWWSGEDNDPESGLSHMGHVGWHALALLAFSQRNVGTDNRPPPVDPLAAFAAERHPATPADRSLCPFCRALMPPDDGLHVCKR